MIEVLLGKDMFLGYWEIVGVLVLWDWYYFFDICFSFLFDLLVCIV